MNMGTIAQNSDNSFNELKQLTDSFYSGTVHAKTVFQGVYDILSKYQIKLRKDDGTNPIMTISIPQSTSGIVVGVRYVKNSGRYTEDHFLFRPLQNLYKCKGKELGKICPEYKGAHELQIVETPSK